MYINVRAVVLKSVRSGEKDKRLSLYTRERGRLGATALGAGRPGARLAAATEPGVEAEFRLWLREGNSFARVTGGGVLASFPGRKPSWSRQTSALFLCEWMDRLTAAQDPNPGKYDLLRAALGALEVHDEAAVRAAFLVQFLELGGYGTGRSVLGAYGEPRWAGLLSAFKGYDFAAPPDLPELGDKAPHLEDQILKFAESLLSAPLKTPAHERELENYRRSCAQAVQSA